MSTYKSRKNAVSRFGLSHKSLLATSALTAAGLIGFGAPASAQVDDHAVWSVGHYEGGTSATITGSSLGYVQYTADTDRVIAVLDQKHIGSLGHVDIKAALWVAKGTGADPMQILGKLTSSGQLLVIDGNGVFFGPGSRVDAAGLIATTGDISNAQLLNNNFGDYEINGASSGAIENHGMINVSEAGLAAFVAPTVRNAGVINAKLGKVVLASGEKVTLDLYGDGLFEVAVDGELSDALIENTGSINAEGGSVNMTAAAAKDAVDNIINVSGVVTVASATQEGGKIVLSGGSKGKVTVSGTLDASGTNGGKIDVKGQNIDVADTASLKADGGKGADGVGNAGEIIAIAEDHMDFRGNISGRGGANGGNGGFAEVSGYGALGFDGYTDLSAANGTSGSLLLDPTFAVIHSGLLNNPLGFNYIISSRALANSLRNNNVTVQADNFIDVGTKVGGYNTGNVLLDLALNNLTGNGNIDVSTWQQGFNSGLTTNNLTLDSSVVNLNKNLIVGSGNVIVDADTLNLDARLYGKASVGGATSLLGDARLVGTQSLTNINVLSDDALINQAIGFGDSTNAKLVTVAAGTYAESVNANKANMTLQGAANHASVITPNSPGFHVVANNVTVDGFTINNPSGADGYGVWVDNVSNTVVSDNIVNNSAGIASLYVVGSTNTTLQDNEINNAGIDSIRIVGGTNTDILGNVLNNSGTGLGVNGIGSGIVLVQANDVLVDDNDIVNAARIGVYAGGSSNVTISNNRMSNIGTGTNTAVGDSIGTWSGVHVEGTNNLNVSGNTINGTTGDGINLGGFINPGLNGGVTGTILVDGNHIFNTGDDGIEVLNSANAQISNNVIGYTNAAGTIPGGVNNVAGVGVRINNGAGAVIRSNKLANTGGWGAIEVVNTNGATIGGAALADGNNIRNSAADGVRMENSSNITVRNNDIDGTGRVGIWGGNVNTAFIRDNKVNHDLLGGYGSIHADGGSNWTVSGNDIDNGDYGIFLNGTGGTNKIDANRVDSVTADGIRAINTANLTVEGNLIGYGADGLLGGGDDTTIGADGIYVNASNGAVVKNNGIVNTGSDGVEVRQSSNIEVTGNAITRVGSNGVYLDGVTTGLVDLNVINGVNFDVTGIRALGGSGITITRNDIDNVSNGVWVDGVNTLWIDGNDINNAVYGDGKDFGIRVVNSNNAQIGEGNFVGNNGNRINNFLYGIYTANNTGYTTIDANDITNVDAGIFSTNTAGLTIVDNDVAGRMPGRGGYDGIHVDNSDGAIIGANTDGNTVRNFNGNGIELIDSDNASIAYNTVYNISGNGVFVDPSVNVDVAHNVIHDVGQDGIHADEADLIDIWDNNIDNVGDDGIDVRNSVDAEVWSNDIYNTGDNGIQASDSGNIDIRYNIINEVDGDGIKVTNSDYTDIHHNTINLAPGSSNTLGDGIDVSNTYSAWIYNNNIDDSADAGVELTNTDVVRVFDNTITDANTGVRLNDSGTNGAEIDNNTIRNVEYGVWAKDVGGLVITDNNIDGRYLTSGDGEIGIYVEDSFNAQIGGWFDGNTVEDFETGIRVIDSASADVEYNHVHEFVNNGIRVVSSDYVDVKNNEVHDGSGNGIFVQNSDNAEVNTNTVYDITGNGIYVDPSDFVDIAFNTIHDVSGDGILLEDGDYGDIWGNTIYNIGRDGIDVNDNDYVEIWNNNIDNTGDNGIEVSDSYDADIHNNDIDEVDGDGIFVERSFAADIYSNDINVNSFGGNTLGDGIEVVDSAYVDIYNNTIDDTVDAGIELTNTDNVEVYNNLITDANTGVRLNDSGTNGAEIDNNTIRNVEYGVWAKDVGNLVVTDNNIDGRYLSAGDGSIGIYVEDSFNAQIGGIFDGNTVEDFETGIRVIDSASADVEYNDVSEFDNYGIWVSDSDYADVKYNDVYDGNGTGIRVFSSDNAEINDNDVQNVDGHGIELVNSHNVDILRNEIDNVGQHGIYVDPSNFVNIGWNEIHDAGWDGINLEDGIFGDIFNNHVGRTGGDGIDVDNNYGVDITNNYVHDAGDNGIEVSDSFDADVIGNDITGASNDGINLVRSRYADIRSNTIFGGNGTFGGSGVNGAGRDGIHVEDSAYVDISSNTIQGGNSGLWWSGGAGAGRDGIHVENGYAVDVEGNTIRGGNGSVFFIGSGGRGANGDGIDVEDSAFALIRSNDIDNVGDNGIEVSDSFDAEVRYNEITGAGNDGINLVRSAFADIYGNTIFGKNAGFFSTGADGAGRDGIHVEDSAYVDITNNTIRGGNGGFFTSGGDGAARNGIYVADSFNADVIGNLIQSGTSGFFFGGAGGRGAGADGIFAYNIFGGDIRFNTVRGVGDDGIDVRNSAWVDIVGNDVSRVGDNGIQVDRSFAVDVIDNDIAFAGNDGIHVERSAFADIRDNVVAFVFGDGIDVERSFGTEITGNRVRFAADNGIELQGSDNSVIDNNDVRFVGDNGIYVNPSNNVTISNNTINDTFDDGIDVNGGNNITISGNLIGTLSGNIGDDGIDVDGSSNVTISNNQITDASEAGIELTDTDGVNILFNDIYENGNYGLWARGAGNKSIVLAGNTFTDNRVGARFESGAIDLTDLANPNSFIFTPGFFSDALSPAVGMQFELAKGADLTIVDETLGSTIFTGFINRPVGESYYVRFEDGAILDALGNVITIDGTLASWDGIIPNSFGNILPAAVLKAIEDRLFDADDDVINGRGQIFVGTALGLDNVEDFFNRFGNLGTGPSGLNLTITGLPRVTPGALNLGAITPFAGGEEGVAGIEPAAGDEEGASQAIQDIEPAAGENDAACWGDALNAAVNGSVNYNFTGDMQEMMNDASNCGTVVGAL